MKVLGYLLLIPAAVGNAILRGYVLTVLWAWFVVSQFPSLPHLGIVAAMGLVITVGLFRSPTMTDKETRDAMAHDSTDTLSLGARWLQTGVYALVSLLAWFSGWIWHHFM